ncbi:MAG: TolC family protein, partial [Okeania sp. SIO2H7]|nr:TolC family protein [Okeania sp. SIO2H7]
RMPAVRELDDPEIPTAELAGDNSNLAQESIPNLNPTESFPSPLPDGTLETLPPARLQPSLNPLEVPITPDAVQIEETIPITLEQAIDLARRYSPALEVARLQLEQSQALLQEARGDLLPSLTFQSQLQRQISAQGELGVRAARRQAEILGQEIPDLDNFGTTTLNNTLQLNYNTGIDGARSARIEAAREQVKLQKLEFERIAEDLRLQVNTAYYDLQEADGRVDVGEVAVTNAQRSLQDAEALERAGVGTRFDVLQAQVTLANEEQNLTNALRDQRISRRRLVDLLNVNEEVELVAADAIERAGVWEFSLDETIVAAFKNRAELEQELVQRDLSDAQRQIALSAIRPQLNLFANYSVLGLITDDVDPGATRGWADGYTLGATFTWNFFDGRAAKSRAKQNEVDIELAETRFDRLLNQIRLEVEEGFYQLEASFDNIATAELGLEQAREALRLARLRFRAGVGTQLEVINSQTDFTRTELNLLVAILNYNRALSQLQRSVSNLPDNNLSDTP